MRWSRKLFLKKCIAKDGHLCNSKEESVVDNFLFFNNIEHEREVLYPYHVLYNISGTKRNDFLIHLLDGSPVYIEYAGLIDKYDYSKKLDDKIELCKDLNIHLIVIYPYQLGQLQQVILHKIDKLNYSINNKYK